MLSRLYDERVFTSSDDVVFSTSTSQALRRNGDNKSRRLASESQFNSKSQRQQQRHAMKHSDLEEEEEESKSDGGGGGSDASAEEEDEEEEEEAEMMRLRGLKFPLQSPRHISASQSYLYRQRRRQLQQELQQESAPLSPTSRRRLTKKLLDGDAGSAAPQHIATTRPKGVRDVAVKNTFHDRPMELVFLPTGEIRPRDECPPGLKLPLASMAPVRMLREEEEEEEEQENNHLGAKMNGRSKRSSKSRAVREEEESSESSGEDRHMNGKAGTRAARRGERETRDGERDNQKRHDHRTRHVAPSSRSYRPEAIETKYVEERKTTKYDPVDEYEQKHQRVVQEKTRQLHRHEQRGSGEDDDPETSKADQRSLQSELQKEKKRVLQKMTQLLEEQGKVQALQRKLEIYESKVASMEGELKVCAGREEMIRERDTKIQSLAEEVRAKDERISRLEAAQITAARTQELRASERDVRPTNAKDEDRVSRLRQREAALATQLEDLMNRVTTFHSRVETWKVNSRDALESCDKRADVLELMDRLWVDFPPFISDNRKTTVENEGESSTVTFLMKRVRQKEEELRVTQLKYVELKELCARQCIREADLQNFINEHRLRGNLVIPDTVSTNTHPRGQENQQVRGNGHNHARDPRGSQKFESDDDEDGEEDVNDADDEEVVVRRPRVFIDIKRADQQRQQSDIEHVRLAPSPGLAQRYREQQQEALQQRAFGKPASKTRTSAAATSNQSSRAPTVASASRTLSATRQASASTTTRTSVTQKRTTATLQTRSTGVARSASSASRTTAATRTSATSRRPSSNQPPLSARPWV